MICGSNCPNYRRISDKKEEVQLNRIDELSEIFKILSDPTRLKIICSLLNNEIKVLDIASKLNINRTTVSHQLKILSHHSLIP